MGSQALNSAKLVKKYCFAAFIVVVPPLFIICGSSHRYRNVNIVYFKLTQDFENRNSIVTPRTTVPVLGGPAPSPQSSPQTTQEATLLEATLEGEGRMFKLKKTVEVSCQQLFMGNMTEIKKIKGSMELKSGNGDDYFLEKSKSCSWVSDYFNASDYSTK